MPTLKTTPNQVTVDDFLATVADKQMQADAHTLVQVMQEVTGQPPVMWGGAIIGFGSYHYQYASGHQGDMCKVGFSPRKDKLSLYISCSIQEQADLLQQLGKHKTGKGCLYIKKLSDVNMDVLKKMVDNSYKREIKSAQ